MFERVNRDRAKNHLPKLKFDPQLCDIARSHSMDMRDHHFFEHESPTYGLLENRLHRAGYLFIKGRENLAEAPTVDESEDGLLKSPHHYENLMAEDITHVGIGIVKGGVMDARNLTVTQIFATPGKRESDAQAMTTIEAVLARTRASAGNAPIASHSALNRMAQEQLATLLEDPNSSNLQEIGIHVAAKLASTPIAGTSRVSVGAQVIVDSSQFVADGAVSSPGAKYYGIAVDHGSNHGSRVASGQLPRLRVLLLVGIR